MRMQRRHTQASHKRLRKEERSCALKPPVKGRKTAFAEYANHSGSEFGRYGGGCHSQLSCKAFSQNSARTTRLQRMARFARYSCEGTLKQRREPLSSRRLAFYSLVFTAGGISDPLPGSPSLCGPGPRDAWASAAGSSQAPSSGDRSPPGSGCHGHPASCSDRR